MARREGNVYLYLFVATVVLFGGALVWAFVENSGRKDVETKLNKALADKITADKQRQDVLAERDDLRELMGGKELRTAWPGKQTFEDAIQDAQKSLNAAYQRLENRTPSELHSLVDPLKQYKDLVANIITVKEQAVASQNVAKDEAEATRKSRDVELKKKDEQVDGLRTQVSDTQASYEKKVTDLTKEGERLQKDLASIKDQMATAEIQCNREKQKRDILIASLQQRLDQLMEEQRKTKTIEDVDPDGQVLQLAGGSGIGWVDIGRKQHLRPGLAFKVFQNIKGGKRQYKGEVEIRKVDEATSEFRVVSTIDELNPIARGDFITSPFYDPRTVPIFVIAGEGLESKNVTEEALRTKIKSYGAEIHSGVDLKTSFLIALKGYEKSDLYKQARDLGVAVIREKDILEYMGF